jgi:hypothetical protein
MSFGQKVGLFFQVLIGSLLKALSCGSHESIALTDRLYMRVPKAELTLMSVGGDVVQSMTLSVSEAEQIFRSIKRACDLHEVVEVKVGDLSWTTDGTLKSGSEEIIIIFNGPLGYTREVAKREDVVAAVTEFADRFGLK